MKKVNGLTEVELKDRIESHLINYHTLIADDFDIYFIDWTKKILDLIDKVMGKPVSDRSSEITVRQFGVELI